MLKTYAIEIPILFFNHIDNNRNNKSIIHQLQIYFTAVKFKPQILLFLTQYVNWNKSPKKKFHQ